MDPVAQKQSLPFSEEECRMLAELLEAERNRLLVGIRHSFHRSYRDELHRRLQLTEALAERFAKFASAGESGSQG